MSIPPASEKAPSAINTNVRLFDLVRYMRSELHRESLITDDEYAWLSGGSPMAKAKEGGSPSPRRLEDYDELRTQLTALQSANAELREENRKLREAWKEADDKMHRVVVPALQLARVMAPLDWDFIFSAPMNGKANAGRINRPELNWTKSDRTPPEWMIVRYGEAKARRIGQVAMIGGKDKTRIRNATPPAFRDLLLQMAVTAIPPPPKASTTAKPADAKNAKQGRE